MRYPVLVPSILGALAAACGGSHGPDVPEAPVLSATAGDSSCTIEWDAPAGARSYRLYHASFSPVPVDADAVALDDQSYTATGLPNGRPTYFVVFAEGLKGDSPASAEVSCVPRTAAGPIAVSGDVVWDGGDPAGDVSVTVQASYSRARGEIDWLDEVSGSTDASGHFDLTLSSVSRPASVRISLSRQVSGGPEVALQRWFDAPDPQLDTGSTILVDATTHELTISDGAASTGDGAVELSDLPPEVDRIFAAGFDPAVDADAFPGDFSEEGRIYLRSYSFAWIEALDDSGQPVTELSSPATLRMRVQPSHYPTIRDDLPDTDRIDVLIYTFDEDEAVWVEEGRGWLQDASGRDLGRDDLGALHTQRFSGEVYVATEASHFSWYNLDAPCVGPWPLGALPKIIRNTECTRDAFELADTIMQTDLGAHAYDDVNKPGMDIRDEVPDCSAPMPRPHDFGDKKRRGFYAEKNSRYIELNQRFWGSDGCKSSDPEKALAQKCSLALTLLHETAHWKHHMLKDDGVATNEEDVGGEAGRWFEKELFGVNVYGRFYYAWGEGNNHAAPPKEMTPSQLSRICNRDWWVEENNAGRLTSQTMDDLFGASSSRRLPAGKPTLSASTAVTSVAPGDPIPIDVTLHNGSSAPIYELAPLRAPAAPISFDIVEDGTREAPYLGGKIVWDLHGADFVALGTGRDETAQFELATSPTTEERYDFLPGHSYEITAVYPGFYGGEELRSAPLTVRIDAGSTLSGSVTDASTGDPIANARLVVSGDNQSFGPRFTAQDGGYELAVPAAGSYSLNVAKEGYASTTVDVAIPGTADVALAPFQAGTAAATVDFSAEGITIEDLALAGGVLYGRGSGGLAAFDLTTPGAPAHLWTRDTGASAVSDIKLEGTRLYLDDQSDGRIHVYDVSTPASPVELGQSPVTQSWFDVENQIAYAFNVSLTDVIDLSDPANPVVLGSPTPANSSVDHYVAVANQTMYVLVWTGDIQGFDMSDPTMAVPSGTLPFGKLGDYVLESDGDQILAFHSEADGSGVIKRFDVSTPASPVKLWEIQFAPQVPAVMHDVAQDGDLVAVTVEDTVGGDRVELWDVSQPATPVQIGEIPTSGAVSVALGGGLIVVSGESQAEVFAQP